MINDIKGFHHVTAMTARVRDNFRFYTEVLGLRLVKKTVNQDDVSAYHLFYADAVGTPGTDITFFDWPQLTSKKVGGDMVETTVFKVASVEAVDYWQQRLTDLEVADVSRIKCGDQEGVMFEDPEGQSLAIFSDQEFLFNGQVWSETVSSEYALMGFDSVWLSVLDFDRVSDLFARVLSWQLTEKLTHPVNGLEVARFSVGDTGRGQAVYLQKVDKAPVGFHTAGNVHHVAFEVGDQDLNSWQERLNSFSHPNSGVIDRFYFRSLYFPVSSGILFELATTGPGFTADQEVDELGKTLSLPPFLESDRFEIEAGLKPL